MKIVKKLLLVVLILLGVVVALIAALPLWFGPVVKGVANSVVPGVVKTNFHLGQLSLNPYTGRFELGEMELSNPEGYSEKQAVKVGNVVLDLGMTTLPTDTVHVEEITLKDIFVSLVHNQGVSNFDQIKYNVAGGKEQYEAKEKAKTEEAKAKVEVDSTPQTPQTSQTSQTSEKRFVIDKLTISGLKLKVEFIPMALPDITLTDIGKKNGGATWSEVWQDVVNAVMKSAGAMGDGLKQLGTFTNDAAKATAGAVGNVAGKTADVVGNAASKTTDAVGNVAGKTADVVGNAASKTTDAVGDAAKKATDAVGEKAGKAVDALKKLW